VVRHHGGTVDEFTGDGLMAVFGAPVALEDHALRACHAAVFIHEEVDRLSGEGRERDGVELRLRVGLNSGQVIVGEIGSGPMTYTAIGEQVGMAQRMESVAAPAGVMLSESTARLVGDAVTLSEPRRPDQGGARQRRRFSPPPWVWRCSTSIATGAYAAVGAAMR
jgi:adenylate cyclase